MAEQEFWLRPESPTFCRLTIKINVLFPKAPLLQNLQIDTILQQMKNKMTF